MWPLQLIISVFLLLPPSLLSAALNAKPGCLDRCGDLLIPYPFGVGPNCSYSPHFDINCDYSTDPPKAYLSIMKKQVIEFNQTYIRLKNPFMISACYGLSTDNQRSMTVNLSGTPYMLSNKNVLTVIGCDDMLLQYKGSSTIGGCSVFCADKSDAGFGDCHFNGCCHQAVGYGDEVRFLEAELIDLSRRSQRKKLLPCSYAFIQERTKRNETVFTYPLYYLNNSTALLNDDWASASRPPVVRLDWLVGTENCSRAMNSNTYACLDEKSVCADYYIC
ncbi:wall-associated receptor kinase 1-like [Salvia hispanica]|uniref:wall-associated receptor kinase 1-like n=1 Tax=Salvia hispanica TaxID=49212 RepID=UPI0020097DC2|nr:wall-associated receptor kinase 1-like [Salvia hispanica]